MAKITRFFYKKFIDPKSNDEDLKRREFIINILLMAVVLLFGIGFIVVMYQKITLGKTAAFSPLFFFIIFSAFLLLNLISRIGHFIFSAYIFISMLFVLTVYAAYGWGVEVPSAPLFFVLIIVISSILISTRFSFFVTLLSSLAIVAIGYFQRNNLNHPDLSWKTGVIQFTDIVGFIIIFLVIVIVSWLSNREIEKSLARARRSEAELKKERDLLEIKVEERTKELQEVQAEKLAQLSRFAEFGRLSSGLFHDLMNPLTAVSLNMEKARSEQSCCDGMDKARLHLEKAIEVTRKMEEFISAVRRQMSNQENKSYFSLADEVSQIIGILSHKALKAKVKVSFSVSHHIKTYGNAVKFSQVAANLISNAIDACEGGSEKSKEVSVRLAEENGAITMIVKDNGRGIPAGCVNKIFDPFFTTKGSYRGIGIGLSLAKTIIEKDFEGKIEVESAENKGTKFIINFSKKEESEKRYKQN